MFQFLYMHPFLHSQRNHRLNNSINWCLLVFLSWFCHRFTKPAQLVFDYDKIPHVPDFLCQVVKWLVLWWVGIFGIWIVFFSVDHFRISCEICLAKRWILSLTASDVFFEELSKWGVAFRLVVIGLAVAGTMERRCLIRAWGLDFVGKREQRHSQTVYLPFRVYPPSPTAFLPMERAEHLAYSRSRAGKALIRMPWLCGK